MIEVEVLCLEKEKWKKGNHESLVIDHIQKDFEDGGLAVTRIGARTPKKFLPPELQYLSERIGRGIPDLYVYPPDNPSKGTFLEIKIRNIKNLITPEQLTWIKQNSDLGIKIYLILLVDE